ncbi:MAG TPA: glycosyltransferase family 39 protein [Caulobacteraceae bacterium]|nr:glycosyltransferase family 39 protein [Caulobacteraceae bacterium]
MREPIRATPTSGSAAPQHDGAWRATLAVAAAALVLRLAALFLSPLELYPDEAQYWLWSRHLAFGYVSKPPLIAWLIAVTTAAGHDGESFVRFSSPLIHAAATLVVGRVGRRLYDGWTGAAAAALYALAPGVALSSFVVSTDAGLMLCRALALWAYAALQSAADGRRRLVLGAAFGAALGLGFLAKYAVLYALVGVAAHLALSRTGRRAWSLPAAGAALAAFAVLAGPNIAWNATHGFATVAHTASNANWRGDLFHPAAFGAFLGAQFGVFGPVPFAVLVGGGAFLAWRRRLTAADGLLLAFAAPPLLIVAVQALISRANANWAAAAYVPAAVLAAAWLLRWKARRWLAGTLWLQGLISVAILVFLTAPALADRAGLANSLKRVRGWKSLTGIVAERAKLEDANGRLSAVALDDRFFFNEAAYYGRDTFGPGGLQLAMWLKGRAPENQAELEAPLTAANGARVLAVSVDGRNAPAMAADFARTGGREIDSVGLDRRHKRTITMFLGEAFTPKPR